MSILWKEQNQDRELHFSIPKGALGHHHRPERRTSLLFNSTKTTRVIPPLKMRHGGICEWFLVSVNQSPAF